MEQLLYNPELMSEADIRATFVARQKLLDDLLASIKRQPDGAGVQHTVIIAPRGMGKTTLLLMLKFALKDQSLDADWQAVKFPEESYGIYDLADFFLETLKQLAAEAQDAQLRQQAEQLSSEYRRSEELQEAALALLKDWRKKHAKRLLLLVENFDQILAQIDDERANARLREQLMNDGALLLIGTATTFFQEARAYEQPLYNFFKIENLADLNFEQMQDLLRQRAKLDGLQDFEQTLQTNRSRLRALEYFTGGNPRLILILYRVITQSDISEVRSGLEKLLDEVTPYYKAKIESLPPQQRKILDTIARLSGQTSEGVTPGEIAKQVRLSPNQVSSQLKRLADLAYVRAANLRGRSSYYTLSEPLYAIWHQMRFNRDARQRMGWLVTILHAIYQDDDFAPQSQRLSERFQQLIETQDLDKARDVLERHRYLILAMDHEPTRASALDRAICDHLALGEIEIVNQELLGQVPLWTLADETLKQLLVSTCITPQSFCEELSEAANSIPESKDKLFIKELTAGLKAFYEDDIEAALRHINYAATLKPESEQVWYLQGRLLQKSHRFEEALQSYNKSIAINPNDSNTWYQHGKILEELHRFDKALQSYESAIAIKSDDASYWIEHSTLLLTKFNRTDDAIQGFDKAILLNPRASNAWLGRSGAYFSKTLQYLTDLDFDAIKTSWLETLTSLQHLDENTRQALNANIIDGLIELAKPNQAIIRSLLSETEPNSPFFPLARALDYLHTGDPALIEKLSPETKGVVEAIVQKLGKPAQPARKPKSRKAKSSRQSRKQL